jgi:predicted nucleotide-binding protein (sugar kinase/HSP70/actin superfamily)
LKVSSGKGTISMKIGIPHSLFSAYHLPYWRKLLALLNLEIVMSEASNKTIADLGSKLLPHEFCIPVKVFVGHVVKLMEQKVELILLPFMNSAAQNNFFCPKLIGLFEIVKYSVGLDENCCFAPEIRCDGLQIKMTKLPRQKIIAPFRFRLLEREANGYWQQFLQRCQTEKLTLNSKNPVGDSRRCGAELTIGLLGYAYVLYDPFISKGIINKLVALGVAVRTWEMLDPLVIDQNLRTLKRQLYWNFGKVIFGAGLAFLNEPEIDGIIYVSTFGCGPDSVVTKLLSIEAERLPKPLLMLNLDEHLETGHLQTRLEAFVDMLAERQGQTRGRKVI